MAEQVKTVALRTGPLRAAKGDCSDSQPQKASHSYGDLDANFTLAAEPKQDGCCYVAAG